jgi:hypothetical protein
VVDVAALGVRLLAISLWVSLVLPTSVRALEIAVEVRPRIEYSLIVSNLSTNTSVLELTGYVENVGSVGCAARLRADFVSPNLTYTAWSARRPIWPGAGARLTTWAALPTGNYTLHLHVHYCYLTYEHGSWPVHFANRTSRVGAAELVKVRTFPDHLEVRLRAWQQLDGLVLIPAAYPPGWIFEPVWVGEMAEGDVRVVRMGYEPAIWQEENVTLWLLTLDGELLAERTFTLRLVSVWERIVDWVTSHIEAILRLIGF